MPRRVLVNVYFEEFDMENDNLVVLRTYSNSIDAEIAKDHLNTNGIEALIKNDTVDSLWPDTQHFLDVRLIVPFSVKNQADEILRAMEN